MIVITASDGSFVKWIQGDQRGWIGFHRLFGFITESSAATRTEGRKLHGLRADRSWVFRFNLEKGLTESCTLANAGTGRWSVQTSLGLFHLAAQASTAAPASIDARRVFPLVDQERNQTGWALGALSLVLLAALLLLRPAEKVEEVKPVPVEYVTVKTAPMKQVVRLPISEELKALRRKKKEADVAIRQNLGFLSMVGNKNLKAALGGVPTHLAQASPGAGRGGTEGSGGEMIMGLGKGVRRATVGNTGVAGLGGIGTKGQGGGQGGYGDAVIGSGNGARISSLISSDEFVLDGGLDRSVIQATIARYLSQIRACYERGLAKRPGLSGQVSMAFTIGAAGLLNDSKVSASTLDDSQVESCIRDAMMKWQFPKPLGGVQVKVKYPFLLRPVET